MILNLCSVNICIEQIAYIYNIYIRIYIEHLQGTWIHMIQSNIKSYIRNMSCI